MPTTCLSVCSDATLITTGGILLLAGVCCLFVHLVAVHEGHGNRSSVAHVVYVIGVVACTCIIIGVMVCSLVMYRRCYNHFLSKIRAQPADNYGNTADCGNEGCSAEELKSFTPPPPYEEVIHQLPSYQDVVTGRYIVYS